MSKAAALDVAEKVIDETIEVVGAAERIPKLWLNGTTKKQQILILSITALGGAAVSAGVSFTVLKRRLTSKYERILEEEIQKARVFYTAVHDKPPLSDLVEEVAGVRTQQDVVDAARALQNYGGHNLAERGPVMKSPEPYAKIPVTDEQIQEVETSNIFVEGSPVDENFDYEAEIAQRSPDAPYIISKQEFNAGEKEYNQQELTYYEGDDILCDERGTVDTDFVGDLNLHRFGHGSGDNNMLYVRNEDLEIDFVILRSKGEYTKQVLGLQHSDGGGSRKQRRARWGDDE